MISPDQSPERLSTMSPSELADAMEEALDSMTEETYDSGLISAYLEALDRVSPIPEHPSSEQAYTDLKLKLNDMAGTNQAQNYQPVSKRTAKRCRVLRACLAAALMAVLLFGAFGVNVLGAIAQWTGEIFCFGELPEQEAEVPEEYSELKAALDERGLPFRAPVMPEGFTVAESLVFIHPDTNLVEFTILYKRDNDVIIFEFVQFDGKPKTVYEKDSGEPEEYNYNNIPHYLFENAGNQVAVWTIDDLEYSLSTNTNSINLKRLIQSFYEV